MGNRAPTPSEERAVVLFSGGIDSSVVLAWALKEGFEVFPLSIDYPGRPRKEREAAGRVAQALGSPSPRIIELAFLKEAAEGVQPQSRLFGEAPPPGYVPARNALFYSVAYHVAELEGISTILAGHNAEDARRYPDANPRYLRSLGRVLSRGFWVPSSVDPREGPRILLPLSRLTKSEVLRWAERLGVPLERTWSCYEDTLSPCGICEACRSRKGLLSKERSAVG